MSRTHRFGGYFLFCCGINSVYNMRVSIWGLGYKVLIDLPDAITINI